MAASKESVEEMIGLRFPTSFYDQARNSARNSTTLAHSASTGDVFGENSIYSATRIRQVQVQNVTAALKAAHLVDKGDDHWELDIHGNPRPPPAATTPKQAPPGTSDEKVAVLHDLADKRPGRRQFVRLSMPCGFGKSGVLATLAALRGGCVLIVTNDQQNATQVLNDILTNTNLAATTSVKIAVTNDEESKLVLGCRHATKKNMLKSTANRQTFPATSKQIRARTVFEPGDVHGILILKRNLLWEVNKASPQTTDISQRIFSTFWEMVLIDECDSVTTKLAREALNDGRCYDWPASDEATTTTYTRFKLNFDLTIMTSATLKKHDKHGDLWLKAAGPLLTASYARDGEAAGTVAYTTIRVLRCDPHKRDDQAAPWYRALEKRRPSSQNALEQLSHCSPQKAMLVELLVHAHMVRGEKIIVYARNLSIAHALAALFPLTAVLCTGESVDGKMVLERFKKQERGILITTSVGQRGFDCPDLGVAINAVNEGESSNVMQQRMGRAQRISEKQNVKSFYDLVSPEFANEVDGVTDLKDILQANRYTELRGHKYEERMQAHDGAAFLEVLFEETKQAVSSAVNTNGTPLCAPDADPETALFCNRQNNTTAIVNDPVVELAYVLSILDHHEPTVQCIGKRRIGETAASAEAKPLAATPPPKSATMVAFEAVNRQEAAQKNVAKRLRMFAQRAKDSQAGGMVLPTPVRSPAPVPTQAPPPLPPKLPWTHDLDDDQRCVLVQQFARCLPDRKNISLDDYADLAKEVTKRAKEKIVAHDTWRGEIKKHIAPRVASAVASAASAGSAGSSS
jgi:superfamily II DNA or RNA helicase